MGRYGGASGKAAAFLLLFAARVNGEQGEPGSEGKLKSLSLEQLGNLEVTSVSKEPVEVMRTPAAIYVITHEDIRRSGATSSLALLGGLRRSLLPRREVGAPMR